MWASCKSWFKFETKIKTYSPFYPIWSEPSEKVVGVFINLKVTFLSLQKLEFVLHSVDTEEITLRKKRKYFNSGWNKGQFFNNHPDFADGDSFDEVDELNDSHGDLTPVSKSTLLIQFLSV